MLGLRLLYLLLINPAAMGINFAEFIVDYKVFFLFCFYLFWLFRFGCAGQYCYIETMHLAHNIVACKSA